MALPLALGGALCIAIGFVAQQHAAAQEPADVRLSPRLLVRLAHRPVWLAGIAAMVAGQLLSAGALDRASLALVEPIMATNLLFALPLSAVWHRRRIGRQEWAGAVALVAGLVTFMVAGDPRGGTTVGIPWYRWAVAGGCVLAVAVGLLLAGTRLRPKRQATLLAGAAGTLYGLQDAFTKRTLAQVAFGLVALVRSWPPYALIAVAVTGLVIGQSAFEMAPLDASLPAITVAEPLTGIAIGIGVFDVRLDVGPYGIVFEILGAVAMTVGMWVVARSPVVSGPGRTGSARSATGRPISTTRRSR